jgi:hypothetical protein
MRGDQISGGDQEDYVLARPMIGPVQSVPEATCTADASADALELEDVADIVDESMLGRWVEIYGELEKETSDNPDNLREIDVNSAKLVPVIPPRVATAPPPQRPVVRQQPITPPQTARVEPAPSLPTTASPVPAIGLLGLLSLGGGFLLRSFRFRRPE